MTLQESVVVITGASSGIGRATAIAFAQQGATVVVAARREQALQELVGECESAGGKALAVRTDVTREDDVNELARRAVDAFGHIDVWVNNAAVTMFARVEDAPMESFRKVIDTNFFGYAHGARAVIPIFRKGGKGTIINVASMVAVTAQPFASAYVASKFAIRGLTDSLRMELEGTNIHVCLVLPASMDTPLFQHAANYTGVAVQAMPPVYDPSQVADVIVDLARNPRRQVFVGTSGRGASFAKAVAPRAFERLMTRQVQNKHFQNRPAESGPGNLFEPMAAHTGIRGGWDGKSSRRRAVLVAGAGVVGLVAAGSGALLLGPSIVALFRGRRRRGLRGAAGAIARIAR